MVLKRSSACFCEFATHLVHRVGTHKGCTRRLFVPYHLNNCTQWVLYGDNTQQRRIDLRTQSRSRKGAVQPKAEYLAASLPTP